MRRVEGPDPQPVVLDSRLRFPIDAKLLAHPSRRVWIATTDLADRERAARLEAAGARLLYVPTNALGRVEIDALLLQLRERGVQNLMVEGGGRVITQFLRAQLVDQLVLTVAPALVGGVRAVERSPDAGPLLRLSAPRYAQLGADLIVWGSPERRVEAD